MRRAQSHEPRHAYNRVSEHRLRTVSTVDKHDASSVEAVTTKSPRSPKLHAPTLESRRKQPLAPLAALFFISFSVYAVASNSSRFSFKLSPRLAKPTAPILISPTPIFTSDYSVRLNTLVQSAKHLTQNPSASKKFILIRAIGNDLPPRHSDGQTLRNLKFILENEHPKPDLDVRWYINRIVDQEIQFQIVQLLVKHNQYFTIDVFNHSAYANIDFNFNIPPYTQVDVLRSSLFKDVPVTDFKRLRVWDSIFEHKNQFIIRNNIVRNNMIALGRATNATYILPWDGNCFQNEMAWNNISASIAQLTSAANSSISNRYFYVPMARMTDNSPLKNASFVPSEMSEEPQIIFHRDSLARFDETKPYGYRPKVDLLWRLRIPEYQFRDKRGNIMRETQAHKLAKDIPGYDSVRPVGWTARVYSGNQGLELDGAAVLRGRSRTDGVELISSRAWLRIAQRNANYSPTSSLFVYNTGVLSSHLNRVSSGMLDPWLSRRVMELIRDAELILGKSLYVRSDGATKASRETTHELATVCLAMLFSGKKDFTVWGTQRVRELMIEGKTRIQPFDLVNAHDLMNICVMLDAVKMLRIGGGISGVEMSAIQAWANELSDTVENSEKWRRVYFKQDREAVVFEAGAGCVHAFSGKFHLALRRFGLSKARLYEMAIDNGNSSFIQTEGLLGLEAWIVLAEMGSRVALNLWEFSMPDTSDSALVVLAKQILSHAAQFDSANRARQRELLHKIVQVRVRTGGLRSWETTDLDEIDLERQVMPTSILPPYFDVGSMEMDQD